MTVKHCIDGPQRSEPSAVRESVRDGDGDGVMIDCKFALRKLDDHVLALLCLL